VVNLTPWPLYPQGKSHWYPLARRLGGPQSQSERGGEEKNSQLLPALEPPIIHPVAQLCTTDLPRLPPPSVVKINAWSYTSTPPIRLRGALLSLAQRQLYPLINFEVFWVVTPCSVLLRCQCFRAPCCLHLQVELFWVVTACSVVVGYRRFTGPCCLHLQVEVFWVVTPCSVVRYRRFRGPCCLLPPHYTDSQPRINRLESSPQLKTQNPHRYLYIVKVFVATTPVCRKIYQLYRSLCHRCMSDLIIYVAVSR
jgi:hypothetical protein